MRVGDGYECSASYNTPFKGAGGSLKGIHFPTLYKIKIKYIIL